MRAGGRAAPARALKPGNGLGFGRKHGDNVENAEVGHDPKPFHV